MVSLLAAGLVGASLAGCLGDGRSAEAACEVWETDGLALHDRFEQNADQVSSDLPGALAEIAGSPGRIATLLDKMAAVAPTDVEPAFAHLAAALRQTGQTAADGVSNPLGALASGLALALTSQGDVDAVNGFLAEHCTTPAD